MGWRDRVKLAGRLTKRFRVWRIDVHGKPHTSEGDYDTNLGVERASVEIRLELQNTSWEKIYEPPVTCFDLNGIGYDWQVGSSYTVAGKNTRRRELC